MSSSSSLLLFPPDLVTMMWDGKTVTITNFHSISKLQSQSSHAYFLPRLRLSNTATATTPWAAWWSRAARRPSPPEPTSRRWRRWSEWEDEDFVAICTFQNGGKFQIFQLLGGVQVGVHRQVGSGQPGQEAPHRRRQRVRPRGRL